MIFTFKKIAHYPIPYRGLCPSQHIVSCMWIRLVRPPACPLRSIDLTVLILLYGVLWRMCCCSTSAFHPPWAAALHHRGPRQNKMDWKKSVTIPSYSVAPIFFVMSGICWSRTQNTFLVGTIYLEAAYCHSWILVPQDVLSLYKYTIYFSTLMYLPVSHSYLINCQNFHLL